jgi:hypothetical protein
MVEHSTYHPKVEGSRPFYSHWLLEIVIKILRLVDIFGDLSLALLIGWVASGSNGYCG